MIKLGIVLLLVLFTLYNRNSDYYIVYLGLTALMIIILATTKSTIEGFQTSNEAVQNIASVYNANNLAVTAAQMNDAKIVNGNITNLNAEAANIGSLTTKSINSDWCTIKNGINLQAPDTNIYSVTLSRTDEDKRPHSWNLWHMNKDYGKNDLQIWEYNTGSDGKSCGSTAGGFCQSQLSLKSGGGAIVHGKLTVEGDLIRNALYRRNDVAGYFKVRAFGKKTPLYYGWNIMWADGNAATKLRNNTKLPVHYAGNDMRDGGDGDQNWTPRHLVVFPGYIARFYYWNKPSTAGDIYNAGEYDWESGSPGGGSRVHLIYISLIEEGPTQETRNPTALFA